MASSKKASEAKSEKVERGGGGSRVMKREEEEKHEQVGPRGYRVGQGKEGEYMTSIKPLFGPFFVNQSSPAPKSRLSYLVA